MKKLARMLVSSDTLVYNQQYILKQHLADRRYSCSLLQLVASFQWWLGWQMNPWKPTKALQLISHWSKRYSRGSSQAEVNQNCISRKAQLSMTTIKNRFKWRMKFNKDMFSAITGLKIGFLIGRGLFIGLRVAGAAVPVAIAEEIASLIKMSDCLSELKRNFTLKLTYLK